MLYVCACEWFYRRIVFQCNRNRNRSRSFLQLLVTNENNNQYFPLRLIQKAELLRHLMHNAQTSMSKKKYGNSQKLPNHHHHHHHRHQIYCALNVGFYEAFKTMYYIALLLLSSLQFNSPRLFFNCNAVMTESFIALNRTHIYKYSITVYDLCK